jgi:hypothetical protein
MTLQVFDLSPSFSPMIFPITKIFDEYTGHKTSAVQRNIIEQFTDGADRSDLEEACKTALAGPNLE